VCVYVCVCVCVFVCVSQSYQPTHPTQAWPSQFQMVPFGLLWEHKRNPYEAVAASLD